MIIERASQNKYDGLFLKHYGVDKDSVTTPLRIVYRCNDKVGSSPSLNDCLESGTQLTSDLGGHHMKFRLFEKAVSADIAQAFLNVLLWEEDKKFTKFLWLSNPEDPDSPFITYQFCSVLFGATCSPFILNAVLRKHLLDNGTDTARRLLSDIYVDNVLTSLPTIDTAQMYYQSSNEILAQAGFRLRAWESNDPAINSRASQDSKNAPHSVISNALGLQWNKSDDSLKCKPISPSSKNPPTPKSVLSDTASLYDVCGFLLPVHVRAKRFMQKLQTQKYTWQQPINVDDAKEWYDIHKDMMLATNIITWKRQVIPGLTPTTPVELHIFNDSSKFAYGSVAFVVANGHSSILWAKNKLISIKDLDNPRIPRYELNSCVLGTTLAQYVKTNISSHINIVKTIMWTDSQIVLHWLKSTKKLEVYVKNRVEKIKAANFDEIRYCPTREMPADLLTRGISTNQLLTNDLWWNGPKFLLTKQYPVCSLPPLTTAKVAIINVRPRPRLPPIDEGHEENETNTLDVTKIMDCKNYSTLYKLFSTSVFVMRFLKNIRRKQPLPPAQVPVLIEPPTVQEISTVRNLWIQYTQQSAFETDIRSLRNKKRTCHARQLKLFVDDQNILRKGSRLKNAHISEGSKYPILLPSKHHFTKLTIRNAHSRTLHGGIHHTVSRLRLTVNIPHIYTTVKSVVRKCVTCNKINSRPYQKPVAPPLPEWRVDNADHVGFRATGCDYTGEVFVKDTDGSKRKVYICLFTCGVTRSVHLEIVQNQTPQQFIMAFRRFTARRSTPHQMWSDNATYFLSASDIIKDIFNDPIVKKYLSEHGVIWKYSIKTASWYGGWWERLIGIMKRTLVKVIGRAMLNESELHTILTEIEAQMNDRPLSFVSSDTDDAPLPLTPSHLLCGRRISATPQIDFDSLEDVDYKPASLTHTLANQRAKLMSKLVSDHWHRFTSEYLPALRDQHRLSKSATFEQKIKKGDVVLVHDDKHKRPLWRIAVVTKPIISQDGLCRAAEIKWSTGTTNRPISKLYPLELAVPEEEDNLVIDEQSHESENSQKPAARAKRQAARDALQKIKNYFADDPNDTPDF